MRMYQPSLEGPRLEFAQEAAAWFRSHPEHNTYTEDNVCEGCLFAVRWNRDHVLAFKISENMEPTLYRLDTEE